jgi:hypothetical protein
MSTRKRFIPYAEKLLDVRWQKKRLKTLESAKWTCEACKVKKGTLHVHHKQYRKGADPWQYERSELMVLCHKCHYDVEERKLAIVTAVSDMFHDDLQKVIDWLKCPIKPIPRVAEPVAPVDNRTPEEIEEDNRPCTQEELDEFLGSLKTLLDDI